MLRVYLIVSSLLLITAPLFSCNYKLLESEGCSLCSKLSSHVPVSHEMIKESLHFVYNTDAIDGKYKQLEQFENMYYSINRVVIDSEYYNYRIFFNDCYNLYYLPENDLKTKVSLHFLVEKVQQKYVDMMKPIERQKRFLAEEKNGNVQTTQADADRIFNMFADAPVIYYH